MSTAHTPLPELPFPAPTRAQCYALVACMVAGGVLSIYLGRVFRLRQAELPAHALFYYNLFRIVTVMAFQSTLHRCLTGKPMIDPLDKTLLTDLVPFLIWFLVAVT